MAKPKPEVVVLNPLTLGTVAAYLGHALPSEHNGGVSDAAAEPERPTDRQGFRWVDHSPPYTVVITIGTIGTTDTPISDATITE